MLLELARRTAIEGSPVGVELLFTVSEERALAGAKAFDVERLTSPFGYVFDHASPIGEIVVASPTYMRWQADFDGPGGPCRASTRRRAAARSSPPRAPSRRSRTGGSTTRRR